MGFKQHFWIKNIWWGIGIAKAQPMEIFHDLLKHTVGVFHDGGAWEVELTECDYFIPLLCLEETILEISYRLLLGLLESLAEDDDRKRKEGRVIFVDLGANIGTHALPIAAR